MTILCTLFGAALILLTLVEVFEGVVLPRRVSRPYRFTRFYYRWCWFIWGSLTERVVPSRRREAVLSSFGPLSLLGLFALWALGLIAGFALVHWAAQHPRLDLMDAFYFSGVTFSTVGYGDISPVGTYPRLIAVLEGATGFGYFALVIGYFPTLYQAFSRREALISLLDARAGSPPAAGRLLVRLAPGRDGMVLTRFLEESERWSAELLESHLSYPVLHYYRSQHGNQSWFAALTCTLDVSALLLTVVEGADRLQARLTFAMARHALVDLALVLPRHVADSPCDRLPEARLRELTATLRGLGTTVREDEQSVSKLKELRGLYEPFVAGLGAYFRLAVPDIWPDVETHDNWQTSAWMRRAGGLGTLSIDRPIDHFD